MRKLELKDIVGYLPYGMNFINKDGVILRMDALQVSDCNVWAHQRYVKGKKDEKDINYPYLSSLKCSGEGDYLRRIKPILRPMSDLTKSIVVQGYNDDKEFVPIQYLYDMCSTPPDGYNSSDFIDESDEIWSFSDLVEAFDYNKILVCLDLLNQWKFDYHNLISEGLAIDINTLNQ